MKVVVTGAFGFVGLALLERLVARYPVIAVGHPPRVPVAVPDAVEVVYGDLALAANHLDHETAIVHLAGGGGEDECRRDPVAAVRTIVGGTSLLAAAATRAASPVRLFASTIAVYGTARIPSGPYDEEDEALADDVYGICKATAEQVWTVHGGGTAFRMANIYGVGRGVDLGLQGAIERFARAAASGGELTVYGEGTQRIDYVNIDDVCAAFEAGLVAGSGGLPPVINLGGGSPIAIGDLARECIRAAERRGSRPSLRQVPAPEGKLWPDRSLSIELARRALGWEPQIGIEEGVEAMIDTMMGAT